MKIWNYAIYSVDEPEHKQEGTASLIEFERLLPFEIYSVVARFGEDDIAFKVEVIAGLDVYKIW